MKIEFVPYTTEWIPEVKRFNARLAAWRDTFAERWNRSLDNGLQFPEVAESLWLPKRPDREVYEEYTLAVEGSLVRGGYVVKSQPFLIAGKMQETTHFRLPISEGIIDASYVWVGPLLVRHALRRYPYVFSFIGGYEQPYAKLLRALGWPMSTVPLYVKVLRSFRFLRLMKLFRTSPLRALLLDICAYTGIGGIAIKAAQLRWPGPSLRLHSLDFEVVKTFDSTEDTLWESCADSYSMIGLRTAHTLNALYPPGVQAFERLRVLAKGRNIGWAIVSLREGVDDPIYGDLRVGLIVDAMARPEDAPLVIRCATQYLSLQGVDLVTSHQAHARWGLALRKLGFVSVASRHIVALGPTMAASMSPFESLMRRAHLTKGDGDGPTNLIGS